jgi:hypothetical protein
VRALPRGAEFVERIGQMFLMPGIGQVTISMDAVVGMLNRGYSIRSLERTSPKQRTARFAPGANASGGNNMKALKV